MFRRTVSLCLMLGLCQIARAEEPVLPHVPKTEKREFQLNDIITVSVDYHGTPCIVGEAKTDEKTSSNALHLDWPKKDGLSFKIATAVVDIRPNGRLVIEGHSELETDGAIWERSLTGVVRPDIVGPERTISSDNVAECRIRIRMKGSIPDVLPNPPEPNPISVAPRPTQQPDRIELQQKVQRLAQLQDEIRQLSADTGSGKQILVRVKMLEVSLTKLRRLDVETKDSKTRSFVKDAADFIKAAQGSGATPYGTNGHDTNSNSVLGFIDWLQKNNIAKSLADPTIVTMDGRPASLNIGGEIPVPTGQPNLIEYKKFGTELDILPIALGNDRVRIELKARVSKIDEGHSIEIDRQHIPSISVRQCESAIETDFGHSAILTGLVETRTEQIKRAGKTDNMDNQIALVLVVTPELVDAPSEVKQASHVETRK